ncbi:MAG: hypothetical protein PHE50_03755, partial [Dehalococcoidales bacterium]|nr:hypothetical protein [Dehalococcoidales bacterium]
PFHAVIRLTSEAITARDKATACHASQTGGGPPRRGILSFLTRLFGQKDSFMRAYPPSPGKQREKDLFAGI